jgi:ABC-type sugar transport system permease subunit
VAFLGFIFVIPFIQTFWYSLTSYDVLTGSARFLGTRNYERVLADPRFWNGLRVGFIYTLGTLAAGLTLQISLAGLLTVFRGLPRSLMTMAYFLPAVLPNLVVVIIWRNMYRVDYGLLDTLTLAIGVRPIPWLSDANWAMVSLILLTVWKYLGYGAVIFVAGLNEIPESLYEAAAIDGASGLRQFFAISLPLLRPLILLQTVASVITLLQFFDPFYALTTGGPSGATQTLILYIYQESFQRLNFSYAAAMTTGLFLVLLAASAAQLWLGRRHLVADGHG